MKLARTLTAVALCVCSQLPALSQETHSASLGKTERAGHIECGDAANFAALFSDTETFKTLAHLACGETVAVLGENSARFTKVRTTAGMEGFVNSSLLLEDVSPAAITQEAKTPLEVVPPAAASSAVSATSTSEYRRASNAPTIPGRISTDQMRAILAGADEESRRAFSYLVQQTGVLPTTLLLIQEEASHRYEADDCKKKISSLQGRLGKSLQPKRVEDVVAMNEVLRRRVDDYCVGQFSSLGHSDLSDIFARVNAAVDVEKQWQERIENAKKAIIEVESTLDQGGLTRANQLYQQLATDSKLPHFAQNYLQQTQSLGLDLASYAQAVQFSHPHDVSLLQQVQNLGREINMLTVAESGRPLTKKYLQDAIKGDTEAVRLQLASLPAFQFSEASYRIPSGLSDNSKLAFTSSHIKAIDDSLVPVSEARAIVAQPDAVKTVEGVVGGNEAAKLNATAAQIAAAEHVRASLVDAQNSVQAKIAAENEARERRIAAAKEAEAKAARAAKAKQEADEEQEEQALLKRNSEWLRKTALPLPIHFGQSQSVVKEILWRNGYRYTGMVGTPWVCQSSGWERTNSDFLAQQGVIQVLDTSCVTDYKQGNKGLELILAFELGQRKRNPDRGTIYEVPTDRLTLAIFDYAEKDGVRKDLAQSVQRMSGHDCKVMNEDNRKYGNVEDCIPF